MSSHPRYALYETDAMLDALHRDGYAHVPAALPGPVADSLREAIDALTPIGWDETHAALGRGLDRHLNVFNRAPFWLGFLDRPGIIELAEAALGADCHVIGMTAWRNHPGYRGDPLHVDYLPPQPDPHPGRAAADARLPIFILTAHFHLHDGDPRLAPTRLVAGSHRARRSPRAGEIDWEGRLPEPLVAARGDALVFRSDVWHSGSDNATADSMRYLLQVHYGRREMAAHFSPFLDWRFEPHVLARATPRQRRLLGDHPPAAYD